MPSTRTLQRGSAIACLLASAALAGLASCNVFDARSGELSCTVSTECGADRNCESGYCVIGSTLDRDADVNLPDADPSAPDAGPCSLLPLMDDFEDGFAAPLWIEVDTAGVTIEEAGGVLTFTSANLPAIPVTVRYSSVTRNYDMTNSAFAIEIPTMVDTASKAEVHLLVGSAGNSTIDFEQSSGKLRVTLSAGGQNVLADIPFNASEHRWWRVVESAQSLFAQTSPDGSIWTTQGTAATPSFVGALGIDLELRALSNGVPAGTLVFDNANIGVDCKL